MGRASTMDISIYQNKDGLKALTAFLSLFFLVFPMGVKAYGNFDGGELLGMEDECTCSAGTTINTYSYVDDSSHVYLYQPGVTQLYANYDIMNSDGYFLTTLEPFSMCLVYEGEDCDDSSQSPEGTFLLTGTSFNFDKQSLAALLGVLPGASLIKGTVALINPPPFYWHGP